MGKQEYIHFFIKFGEKEYMEEFRKGKIFCRPLTYFQKQEKQDLAKRHDKYEGVTRLVQPTVLKKQNVEMVLGYGEFDGEKFENTIEITDNILGPIRFSNGIDSKKPVHCLYAFCNSHFQQYLDGTLKVLFDERVKEFGGYVVFIKDPREFMKRVKKSAEIINLKMEEGLISYIDAEKHHGEYGIFSKPVEFEYQREFRIAFNMWLENSDETFILNIGDISDITMLLSFDELKKELFVTDDNEVRHSPFSPLNGN